MRRSRRRDPAEEKEEGRFPLDGGEGCGVTLLLADLMLLGALDGDPC